MTDSPQPEGAGTVPPARPPRWRRRVFEPLVALALVPPLAVLWLRHATGESGLAAIRDDQIAVLVDGWSGTSTVIDTPGYRPYLPWFQEVHAIDKSPNAFVFQGNAAVGVNHVPRLLVRANDGSSFWFEQLTLHYALRTDLAAHVLADSGGGEAFKEELLRAHARAILRDEFGRFAAGDAARPESLTLATRASLERLNAALEPHAIEVLEVSSPRPAFDKGYEDRINRRKVADQEVERLRTQVAAVAKNGELNAQRIRKDKDLELKRLEANLTRDIGAAGKERVRALAEADNAYADKVSQARTVKAEKELQAAVLTAKYRGLAEDARARAEDVRRHGTGAVRAALVENLSGIQFQLVPYSRDPAPQRIEHEQPAGGKP